MEPRQPRGAGVPARLRSLPHQPRRRPIDPLRLPDQRVPAAGPDLSSHAGQGQRQGQGKGNGNGNQGQGKGNGQGNNLAAILDELLGGGNGAGQGKANGNGAAQLLQDLNLGAGQGKGNGNGNGNRNQAAGQNRNHDRAVRRALSRRDSEALRRAAAIH